MRSDRSEACARRASHPVRAAIPCVTTGSFVSPFVRYLLFQIPGWIIAGLAALLLCEWWGLPEWAAAGIVALWMVKDLVLYPFLRSAYEPSGPSGVEQLVGSRGVARAPLDPSGYVLVRGELWRAEADPSQVPIAEGSSVTVRATRGFTLIVVRGEDA
jgi:membrane protein implicated in regulation of membrane protease activity